VSDVPLPGMGGEPDPCPPKPSPAGIRFTRCKANRLCEECCRQIHLLGIVHAPYPRTARWRVSTGETVAFLCYVHKDEMVSR